MHNTLFIIVIHLVGTNFFIVNFCYFILTVLIWETITFHKCVYRYRDILDNRDKFVANIEI